MVLTGVIAKLRTVSFERHQECQKHFSNHLNKANHNVLSTISLSPVSTTGLFWYAGHVHALGGASPLRCRKP